MYAFMYDVYIIASSQYIEMYGIVVRCERA